MPTSADPNPFPASAGDMLAWIHQLVGFGIRRPGYAQGLQTEAWLEERFREFGLVDVRR